MGHKCSDRDDFNKNHQRKPVQIIKFKRKNGFKKSMKPTSRLNGIKENSKDILEENVEMGVSCSTIIDDKQDKARNNIKGWWRPVSEKEDKVPVIVEAFSEEGQVRDGLVEDGSLDKQGNLSRLNKIKEKSKMLGTFPDTFFKMATDIFFHRFSVDLDSILGCFWEHC